jgi:hypothetical protein
LPGCEHSIWFCLTVNLGTGAASLDHEGGSERSARSARFWDVVLYLLPVSVGPLGPASGS